MRPLRHAAVAAVVVLGASGCMSLYKLPAGSPTASVEIQKGAVAWICDDTPPQLLQRGKDGTAEIPSGRRVTVGVNFVSSDGYMTYSCSPSSSIVPIEGATYLQDFQAEGERCSALLYRKTDDTRIGLAFDPTMQPGGAACTR